MQVQNAYRAFVAADQVWGAEGQRLFGKQWGDKRYTPEGQGAIKTPLRAAYDAFCAARKVWREAVDAQRALEIPANHY